MWQKHRGEYHFLVGDVDRAPDGQVLETACQERIRKSSLVQTIFPARRERRCEMCSRLSCLIAVSVDDARTFLPNETSLLVLYRALEISSGELADAIEARIRQVAESNGKPGVTAVTED